MVSRTLWRLRARRPGGGRIGFGFELNFDQNCTVCNFLVNEGSGYLGGRGRLAVRRCGDWEGRPGRNFLEGALRKLRVQAGEGERSAGRLVGLDGPARRGCDLGESLCTAIGVGSERLAAGDFESVIYSVSTGKCGEF